MGFKEAIISINNLKEKGIIKDYAVGGGYAFNYHSVPQATYDLDVFVISDSKDDIGDIYKYYKDNKADIKKEYIIIQDMPVQFFPNISPLHKNAIEEADVVELDGFICNFISVEHLILLLLTSFRRKDILRIGKIAGKANKKRLKDLFEKFDDKQRTLYKKYEEVLEKTKQS
jgi:predicted nucleotidyltransferase